MASTATMNATEPTPTVSTPDMSLLSVPGMEDMNSWAQLMKVINSIPRQSCSLKVSNDKYKIFVNDKASSVSVNENLLRVLEEILMEDATDQTYYEIKSMFDNIKSDSIQIVNLVTNIILRYNMLLKETLDADASDGMTLESFVHVWKSNQDFCRKLYRVLKQYQVFVTDYNVPHNNGTTNIIAVLEVVIFYKTIYCAKYEYNESSITLGEIITSISHDSDKKNVESVLDFVDCIKAFNYMEPFLGCAFDDKTVRDVFTDNVIVNNICFYLDRLLRNNLDSSKMDLDETVLVENIEKKVLTKIYRIVTLLCRYAQRDFVNKSYVKFFQKRIMDLHNANLELEIELVDRMKDFLGAKNTQVLYFMIDDLRVSRAFNKEIHEIEVNIQSERFQPLKDRVSLKPVSAIVVRPNIWQDIKFSERELNLPLELEFYTKTVDRFYQMNYEEPVCIKWIYSLGNAIVRFNTNGNQSVLLKVNIFQLAVLMLINDLPIDAYVEVVHMSNELKIPVSLMQTLIESLCMEDILSQQTVVEGTPIPRYVINRNYVAMTDTINLIDAFKKCILATSQVSASGEVPISTSVVTEASNDGVDMQM
jgi:hypothetical protein